MSTADRLWPPVMLVSDRRLVPVERLVDVARVAAREGLALAVQLREKDLTAADLLETALRLRQALVADGGAARVAWAINGRFDLALAAGADGVHLPAGGPPVERVRAEVGSRLVLGVSTHSVDEIAVAARAGADYVMTQPAFRWKPLQILEPFRGKVPILVGVLVLRGLEHALRMRDVPGVVIPDEVVRRDAPTIKRAKAPLAPSVKDSPLNFIFDLPRCH